MDVSRARRTNAPAKTRILIARAIESLEPRCMLAAHVLGNPNTFSSIQAAIDAAPAGGTVTVDPGNYTEQVAVYNGITLKGAQAGVDGRSNLRGTGESVITGITGSDGTVSFAFRVVGNDCTIDGFTVQGQTSQSASTGAGIVIAPTVSGTKVLNNIVQNNCDGLYLANASATDAALIKGNVFRNNNVSGPNFGRGIYTDGGLTNGLVQDVTIDNNYFYDNLGGTSFGVEAAIGLESYTASSQKNITITNNVFDHNGKAVLAFDVNGLTFTGNWVVNHFDTTSGAFRVEGGVTNLLIQNNNFYADGARAIRIDTKAVPRSNNTYTITNNNIYKNGLESEDSGLYINAGGFDGTVNAVNNYWGASNGPSGDNTGSGDAIQLFGNLATYKPFATAPVISQEGPWYGRPFDMNGNIQMEDYDHGLEGVSYHDTGSGNSGGAYRPNADVDISTTTDTGGGYVVTPSSGEWLKYTVNVAMPGTYTFSVRYASGSSGTFHVEVDGANVTGSISAPSTGSSSTYNTLNKTGVTLPAGVHVVRVVFDSGSFGSWNWMKFTPTNVAPPPPAPSAPSGLMIGTVTGASIALTWTDTSSNEDNFILERSTDNVNFTTVATPAANANAYTDTNLNSSTLYYYRIRSTNAGGTSSPSNVASATTLVSSVTTLIPTGSVWKYLDNGSNQGTAWRASSFSDSTWKSGAAQLGYGDGDETTVVGYGGNANNKYITTYFRTSFNVADPTLVSALNLRVMRDDGVVIYLNGSEVFRDNMPTGTIAYNTLASVAIGGADESTYYPGTISPSLLVAGTNVIAVEIHQSDVTSSDISFDFELKASVSQPAVPPPNSPTGLAASAASSSQINLNWTDASNDETGFAIDRSTDNVNFTQVGTVAANVFTYNDSTGLSPNTKYYYRIRATNNGLSSSPSNVANATTNDVAPTAPASLMATAVGTGQINLTWLDKSSNETNFILERSTDNFVTGVEQIATPAANATTYSDTVGLSPSTLYYYRIRATNLVGPSANSNTASATTQATTTAPNAPTGLAASAASVSQINLTWAESSTNMTGYVIERSTDNFVSNITQVATPPANALSYSDSTGLSAGTMYYYRIRALNGALASDNSGTASATTTALPSAPSQLAASAINSSEIDLSWVESPSNQTGFSIERSTDGTNFKAIGTAVANATTYKDLTVSASTKYYYRVAATISGGASGDSNIANATTPAPTTTLPAGWTDSDIGTVGVAGSATYTNGTFTVKGAGGGVTGTADGCNYVSESFTGDGTITIKLSAIQNGYAGVMFRQSTAANAARVALVNNTDNTIGFLTRATAGASNVVTAMSAAATGYWLRLTRSGNTFTAYKSADGNTWTSISSVNITMTGDILIGLVCSSTSTSSLATGTLTNLTVTSPATVQTLATTLVTAPSNSLTSPTTPSTTSNASALLDLTTL